MTGTNTRLFRHSWLITLLLAPGLLWLGSAQAAEQLLTFTPQHRPAQDLLPVLQPLLGDHSSASSFGGKLIVRVPDDRVAQVRQLIAQLDTPADPLMIQVRVDRESYRSQQRYQGSGRYDKGSVQGSLVIRHSGTSNDGNISQRVQTLDGHPALIQVGQSIPTYLVRQGQYGSDDTKSLSVQYRNISSGFYVVPHLFGRDGVTLDIYQQDQHPTGQYGRFEQQQAASQVSGRLNEWIALGDIGTRASNSNQGIGMSATNQRRDERHISVRVTRLR